MSSRQGFEREEEGGRERDREGERGRRIESEGLKVLEREVDILARLLKIAHNLFKWSLILVPNLFKSRAVKYLTGKKILKS